MAALDNAVALHASVEDQHTAGAGDRQQVWRFDVPVGRLGTRLLRNGKRRRAG
jgi:hypothetical protein